MCISILLALVVFLLLVSKILPPTSVSIPLIAKYLLFTFIMNIVTIVITVVIINWNFRTPRTHRMPRWIRVIFLDATPHVVVTCALLFYSYRYFASTCRPPPRVVRIIALSVSAACLCLDVRSPVRVCPKPHSAKTSRDFLYPSSRRHLPRRAAACHHDDTELSVGWVDPWVGSGRVHYSKCAKILKGLR